MALSEQPPKTGPVHGLREALSFVGAGLTAVLRFWPRRQPSDDIRTRPAHLEEPGDPGPVLETLEKLDRKAEKTAPYPVND